MRIAATLVVVVLLSLCLVSYGKKNGVASILAINPREQTNSVAHRTNLFTKGNSTPSVDGVFLFLRRGQTFEIELEVDKKLDDALPVEFEAQFLLPTKTRRRGVGTTKVNQPGFRIRSATLQPHVGKFVYTVVTEIPVNASIGFYEGTWSLKNSKTEKSRITKNLLILFNAWVPADPVYMENEADRFEYVLNQEGLIWVGSSNDYSGARWKYNQFHPLNVETVMVALSNPPLESAAAYADPILVSRKLSFAAGDSICWGKWSGNYTHETNPQRCGYKCQPETNFPNSHKKMRCTEPWRWRDVTEMLEMHKITPDQRVQVQWCQCFVFAALVNSLGRTLGLPTRAVTTFQSAADHNINNKIEKYYTEEGGYFKETDDNPQADDPDSIWNFHVWNEAFFRRPAQKTKSGRLLNLDGWQAFDGTPQVASPHTGKYEIGPASLAAVFRNQVDMDYDVKFLVSEVNANISVNVKKADGTWEERYNTEVDPFDRRRTPGQVISTKKPGAIVCRTRACEESRLDLTLVYKKKEVSGPSPAFEKRTIGDITAKLVFPPDDVIVQRGENVNYGYIFQNNADEDISIHVLLQVDAVDYRDQKLFTVANTRKVINVPASSQHKFVKTLTQDRYDAIFDEELIMGAAFVEFTLSARVDSDGSVFFHKKLLQIHDDSKIPQDDDEGQQQQESEEEN